MKTLVLVPCAGGKPASGALSAVTAAQPLGAMVLMVCGSGAAVAAEALVRLPQVAKVIAVECAELPAAETMVPFLLEQRARLGCTHVFTMSGAWARGVMPRAAAVLDVMGLTEVVRVVDERTYMRPVHAGAALMTLRVDEPVHLITVRSSAFELPQPGDGACAPIEQVPLAVSAERSASVLERHQPADDGTIELIGARVVVSGGRGMGSAEGFARLRPLAAALGAALGASRAAVDAGYAAADQQVGQSGKSVAPELYIAVGISGAIQHWVGMKDSKVIVAINKDPDAPIFQFADYGLVGDLFELLPALQARIAALPPRG